MFTQVVDRNELYNAPIVRSFRMIDNYIYLYHTDTLIALPVYPESIQDSIATNFNEQSIMTRTAPIYSYSSSGPRSMQISLPLHRDMMNQINIAESKLDVDLSSEDYVDIMVKQLQSAALPRYASAEKMVNPPLVAVRFGNSIFCKGVVNSGVTVTHSGPILTYPDGSQKYAMLEVNFSVSEVDPYDADSIMLMGGYRGLSTSLEARVWR